ncbi:hypothetical protein [uncultured Mediterranean phage uvMED]|jgi:hypothetical protein|nr:hypothetical protein [uncultured Mediterranean phage uvMED]BAQ91796.1 hypothetical protein [uncultured Mediterranean phage uvMED]BAR20548.1 hypothetical protein [uncultured Mediterranean phage uvMED]
MEMIKLVNGKGDIIERKKIDYLPNTVIWEQRGWKPYVEPKVEPKPEPIVDNEWQPEVKKKSKKKGK